MTTTLEEQQVFEVISAGAEDVDRTLGGGIPYRTLMLIEGQSASGKSTLAQQLVWAHWGPGSGLPFIPRSRRCTASCAR